VCAADGRAQGGQEEHVHGQLRSAPRWAVLPIHADTFRRLRPVWFGPLELTLSHHAR
jgi:hypothetical protein